VSDFVRARADCDAFACDSPSLLLERFNTWVPVYDLASVGGSEANVFYVRVSLQVYNEERDAHFLANAILNILKQQQQ
jgi:selenocysteine lyase/cysteine desulfurase